MRRIFILLLMVVVLAGFALSQEQTICCEQTAKGFYCQDVQQSDCKENVRQLPTSCESTSYCKLGTCYDSNEGTCIDNTPQLVCNTNGGLWNEKRPPQCDLGCCILGDQASFVTLVRCKKLSGFLGLKNNFNNKINNEVQCVLNVLGQEKGACVYDFEFERTCRFTTRAECSGGDTSEIKGEFFPGKLCSAEEIGTNCGPSRQTMCLPGKEEVYFVDTCGNPANIYDSSKIADSEYWTNAKSKSESCGAESKDGSVNSANCGNCNYLLGGYCREAQSGMPRKPLYGENICADLNCKDTQNGNDYKHGESWCVNNDFAGAKEGIKSVGSRYYKHICLNGEEVLEQCAEFRQEECLQDKIETSLGDFSQAACRVNRWQDCIAQKKKDDCVNKDKRDCMWVEGAELPALGVSRFVAGYDGGACFPQNPPGLKFWAGEDATTVCKQGNDNVVLQLTKGLIKDDYVCDRDWSEGVCNYVWDDATGLPKKAWVNSKVESCMRLGDCGANVNWLGEKGFESSSAVKIAGDSGDVSGETDGSGFNIKVADYNPEG